MNVSGTWQLQHAKARLSELVRCAREDGPQVITVHGNEVVVVVDKCEYDRLVGPRRTIIDVLMSAPKLDMTDAEIDELFARDNSDTRPPVSFDD